MNSPEPKASLQGAVRQDDASDESHRRLMRSAKIMMIDDEPINMQVLQLHLKSEGYERFVMISDSMQAMEALRKEPPHVLLLDLNMPVVSGLQILGEIRRDKQLKRLPVIVLTSSSDTDSKLTALQAGASDFLSKPVDPVELALRMRNTLIARAYEQQLMHRDALTGLPNRQFLAEAIKQWTSTGGQSVLVLFNIHRFKSINDSFGSSRGDDVLWAFSRRLRSAFSEGLSVGKGTSCTSRRVLITRLGGDRFGVLLTLDEPIENNPQLSAAISCLQHLLKRPFTIDAQNVFLDVGLGVAVLREASVSLETLINNAESAMLHGPLNATAAYAVYSDEMQRGARRVLDVENGLRMAIANDELTVLYQPKVNVETGKITSAEALLRWHSPVLGPVSPVEFIAVAESAGLIIDIGHWVLEQSCRQAAEYRRAGHHDFCIAVNVSILQLSEPGYFDRVRRVLSQTGLNSSALMVELTENMMMEDVENSIARLTGLRGMGVRISIDDFGTGYSSLSYLHQFPLDQLKIDRSFIMQIDSADSHAPIVNAIVSLAHDLGLKIVAEGVETLAQLTYIKRLRCEEFQGYLASRPVPASEFSQLLERGFQEAA